MLWMNAVWKLWFLLTAAEAFGGGNPFFCCLDCETWRLKEMKI